MAEESDVKRCKRCSEAMSYAELPDFGRVWQCNSCVLALETDEGKVHVWHKPSAPQSRKVYAEDKKRSSKACPECRQPMWEVTMPDFGSRWQCEECRLTVFATGGIQKWKKRVD